MEQSPEQLRERTKAFAKRMIRLSPALPRSMEAQVIAKQLVRSGTSVGANYGAACRARSRNEFVAKLGIVVEEADETIYWLELLGESEIVPMHCLREVVAEEHELTDIFTAAQHTIRSR